MQVQASVSLKVKQSSADVTASVSDQFLSKIFNHSAIQ